MNESLKHHGVLGQKWGVRRFQPYPDGYHGKGKFVGEDSEGNKITKKQYKKNKKELRKDIKNLKNAYDESKVQSERSYNKYRKENAKYGKKLIKGNMDYETMMKEDPKRGINYKEHRRYDRIANNISRDLNDLYVQYRQEYGKKMEFDERGYTGDKDYKRFANRYTNLYTKNDLPLRFSNARFRTINGANLTKPVREILEEYDTNKRKNK